MAQRHCHSCSMPIPQDSPQPYCQYCTDESGDLRSREYVKTGLAEWLRSWAPDDGADFLERAEWFMQAMPAWTHQERGGE